MSTLERRFAGGDMGAFDDAYGSYKGIVVEGRRFLDLSLSMVDRGDDKTMRSPRGEARVRGDIDAASCSTSAMFLCSHPCCTLAIAYAKRVLRLAAAYTRLERVVTGVEKISNKQDRRLEAFGEKRSARCDVPRLLYC